MDQDDLIKSIEEQKRKEAEQVQTVEQSQSQPEPVQQQVKKSERSIIDWLSIISYIILGTVFVFIIVGLIIGSLV